MIRSLGLKLTLFLVPIALFMGYLEFRLARIPNNYSLSKAQLEAELANIEVPPPALTLIALAIRLSLIMAP